MNKTVLVICCMVGSVGLVMGVSSADDAFKTTSGIPSARQVVLEEPIAVDASDVQHSPILLPEVRIVAKYVPSFKKAVVVSTEPCQSFPFQALGQGVGMVKGFCE